MTTLWRSVQDPYRTAGFTLLELLIALAILPAVRTVAFPRIGSTQANVSFQSTTLRRAAELRATRSEAVWRGADARDGSSEHRSLRESAASRHSRRKILSPAHNPG